VVAGSGEAPGSGAGSSSLNKSFCPSVISKNRVGSAGVPPWLHTAYSIRFS
jgi:hypothetical protein